MIRWLLENHEAIRNLGLVAAAVIGLPLLIWRGFTHDRASRASQMQAETTLRSHVADTYIRAIEQLGATNGHAPNLELRLGGIFALEKIAQENGDYHPQIMEVLCAYVRMHAPLKEEDESIKVTEPHRIVVRTCLTVIGRRKSEFDKGCLDLSRIDIKMASLTEANLQGALLDGAKNISCGQLRQTAIFLDGETLANDPELYASAKKYNATEETIFPDYIKVTKSGEHGFKCEKVET